MRITATAVLVLLAAAAHNEGDGGVTGTGPLFLPAILVSAYVPNDHHRRRPGYGAGSASSPKQNSNHDPAAAASSSSSSSSSSAVYYRSTADVYESTDAAYETVQERIQRVRSGHMSESEKRAYLKSALGGTGNALDRITAATGSTSNTSRDSKADATTSTKAWSHPSYTPPRYLTPPLDKDAQSADSKRRYLESVMDPNRFQSFGNVGRASGNVDDAVRTDGMSADEAELAVVQAKIARIEEEKKRIAAEAREKVSPTLMLNCLLQVLC